MQQDKDRFELHISYNRKDLMIKKAIHKLLRNPYLFDFKQRLVTGHYLKMHAAFDQHLSLRNLHPCNILDIGCGTGLCANGLFQPQYHFLVGIDLESSYVKLAKRRYPKSHFLVAHAATLPFAKNFFDVILLSSILHHLSDEESLALFQSLKAALKPDGKILVSEPIWSKNSISNFLLKRDRGHFIKTREGYLHLLSVDFKTQADFVYRYARTEFLGAILSFIR